MPKGIPNPKATSFSEKGTTNVRLDPTTKRLAYEGVKRNKLDSLSAYIAKLITDDAAKS